MLPLIDFVLGTKDVMDGEVGTVLIGTEIIVMILAAVICCIVHSIKEAQINKSLEHKNPKDKPED